VCSVMRSGVCHWPVYRISQVGFHRWSRGGRLWSASPPSCWQVEADRRRTPSPALPLSRAVTDIDQTDLQADTVPELAGERGGGGGQETWRPDCQTDRKFIRKSHLNRFIYLFKQVVVMVTELLLVTIQPSGGCHHLSLPQVVLQNSPEEVQPNDWKRNNKNHKWHIQVFMSPGPEPVENPNLTCRIKYNLTGTWYRLWTWTDLNKPEQTLTDHQLSRGSAGKFPEQFRTRLSLKVSGPHKNDSHSAGRRTNSRIFY